MKTLKQITLFLFTALTIFSCSNNDETTDNNSMINDISAKWKTVNNSTYISFEFNKDGNYIIVKSLAAGRNTQTETINLFGEYEIINENTINLIDFGQIVFTEINNNEIQFSVKENDNEETVIFNGTKEVKINDSTNTDLLCRSWKMNKVNGEDVVGTEYELTVIFSVAGTYFVELANPSDENEGGLAEWTWKNTEETELCYSWNGTPDCSTGSFVSITELTENSLTIVEDSEVYELVLSNNSAKNTINNSKNENLVIKKGFFSKL